MALTFKNLTFWSAEHPKHQPESLHAMAVQHSWSQALNDCDICHGIAAAPTAAGKHAAAVRSSQLANRRSECLAYKQALQIHDLRHDVMS